MEVPRQIKNAELVLVPCLIKGTQLEEVYNMMKEAGVDQLNTIETSKLLIIILSDFGIMMVILVEKLLKNL